MTFEAPGCATCGALPTGMFDDGSPRYPRTCLHPPIFPGDPKHPATAGYEAPTRAHGPDDDFAPIIVELDADELEQARECGKLRFTRAQRRKARDHFGQPSIESHISGASGERAFSKWIGEPWECTTGRYGGAADVAGCQIRAQSRTSLRLKVRDNDPDRIPVVSIVDHSPRFWIRGWIFAKEAKRPEWIDDPGQRGAPGFFIPNDRLRPMVEFLTNDRVRAAMGRPPAGVT